MKRKSVRAWVGLATCIVLFWGMSGTAFGYRVLVTDPGSDLGLLLELTSGDTHLAGNWDALVLYPEKLAVLGLTAVKKGDTVRFVHQVSNLWRIVHTNSKQSIYMRLKWKNLLENIDNRQ